MQATGVATRGTVGKERSSYGLRVNGHHAPAVRFATITHELGHLCLGHLGADRARRIPSRLGLTHEQCEIEAESVAYIVCYRQGLQPKSQTYLTSHVDAQVTIDSLDVFQVMRAAGQAESLLGLSASTSFTPGQHAKAAPARSK